jgi:small subunit ribosomal protein S7
MPRRSKIERRIPAPDARFNNETLSKFINRVMQRGKKGVAERIVYGALDTIAQRTGRNPIEVFEQALYNATPVLEVKPKRVGGATNQVPVQIEGTRRGSLAMRWLLTSAKHGRASRCRKSSPRVARRIQQYGRHDQAARGHPPDGGGQPGLLSLRRF